MIQMSENTYIDFESDQKLERELNCGRSLIQKPMFTIGDGCWSSSFLETASKCDSLTWDPAAMLSFLSFGYMTGNRTMFREVTCSPWMSNLSADGDIVPQAIPEHGFHKMSPVGIAQQLLVRLENEAEKACAGHERVYILTSGGLDSRIVAGIVKRLLDQGRINSEVLAVTWGRSGSRDVEIGKAVAGKLGFAWKQLELSESHLEENIEACALDLGALVSPVHLHRMTWFRDQEPGGIVLAGSYGDSVGRCEFSGKTVLDLPKQQTRNRLGLLHLSAVNSGNIQLEKDWAQFRSRLKRRPEYAIRECEEQGNYMRRMISQAMSIIDGPNKLYQMFTAPDVFGFMWSIHPCYRDDQPYAELLELLGHDLARLPWARTNKPLRRTDGIQIECPVNKYHDYSNWGRSLLMQNFDLRDHIDWLAETGLFDPRRINELCNAVVNQEDTHMSLYMATNLTSWTLSLRKMVDALRVAPIRFSNEQIEGSPTDNLNGHPGGFLQQLPLLPMAKRILNRAHRMTSRQIALLRYPPIMSPSDGPIYPEN
jgi:asparagine synthase (glutamine-hydrolysing)